MSDASKKVIMHTYPDGTTKIEAEGYVGGECLGATEAFEALFDKTVKEREYTGGECAPDHGERVR